MEKNQSQVPPDGLGQVALTWVSHMSMMYNQAPPLPTHPRHYQVLAPVRSQHHQEAPLPVPAQQGPQRRVRPICLACQKSTCRLRSHRAYTERVLASRRNQSSSSSQMPKLSPMSQLVVNPRIDPFTQYPIRLSVEAHELFDHWSRGKPWGTDTTKGPERHLFPSSTYEFLVPLAMNSSILFHTAIALCATQRSLAAGRISATAFEQQRAAAVLHLEMTKDPATASADANILAGLGIMSNHMAQGNMEEARRLIEGINVLVKARGGPQYLGLNGKLAALLLYADHVHAIITYSKPIWPMPLPSLQFSDLPSVVLGKGFSAMAMSEQLDPNLCTAGIDLCRTIQLFDLGYRKLLRKEAFKSFEYLSIVTEYQLGSSYAVHCGTNSRNTCVCLALLMFDHIILRNAGAINPGIRVIESRFWAAFTQADAKGMWEDKEGALLVWTLLTALTPAIRGFCRWIDYAVNRIQAVKARVNIQGWDDLRSKVLEHFIWWNTAQESLFRDIWARVEAS